MSRSEGLYGFGVYDRMTGDPVVGDFMISMRGCLMEYSEGSGKYIPVPQDKKLIVQYGSGKMEVW